MSFLSLLWLKRYHTILIFVDVLINAITCYRVATLIHMMSKRVKLIIVKTEEHDDLLELVLHIRKLFEYNQKLNLNYSLRAANSLWTGTVLFLQSISAYWRVYGLHYVIDCLEYRSPIVTIISKGHVIFEMLSIAWSATSLNNLVSKTTTDIRYRLSQTSIYNI
ncbi:hypothetical protein J6590_049350 [Homalodisca vitripennis]|nr:hypothetical protein J6590_049350 [Homalodisca vitripennis]